MKGLSGLYCFSMVFSNVPTVEQGGEFIGKTIEIEDLQVEPLSQMKNEHDRKVEFGREF